MMARSWCSDALFILLVFDFSAHHLGAARPFVCFVYQHTVEGRWGRVALCNDLNLAAVLSPPSTADYSALVLDKNRIVHLPNGSFDQWPALRRLSLANNRLSQIEPTALAAPWDLRSLDLRRNNLSLPAAIAPGSLPSRLEVLDLSHNPVGVLPDGLFRGLGRLRVLRLVDAQLTVVEPNWLEGLVGLHNLNLFHNRLAWLPEVSTLSHLNNMPQLTAIRLGGTNPWACDCRVRWLKEWLANHTRVSSDTPIYSPRGPRHVAAVCHWPPHLRGRPVFTSALPLDAIRCRAPVLGRNADTVMWEAKLYGGIAVAWLLAAVGVAGAVTFLIMPDTKTVT